MDYYYLILVLPAVLFALWAQFRVKYVFSKYSKKYIKSGITGRNAAELILKSNGIGYIPVNHVAGNLTDHYNPSSGIINLSDQVYNSATEASVGVAAHEAGHAIQHSTGYLPIKIRSAIIPITTIGSQISWPLILIGLVLGWANLAIIGVALFSLTALFQLITLPVEFDASKRALNSLTESGQFTDEELAGAKKVLSAAALTYVAALAVSVAQLIRLLAIVSGSGRRKR
ncbi:MAG TPA: zinc metallopeptidase [Clostridiales bacterium]|jgi:Zn-dependent membrane protease YugP|nr:zinc metallopeptidase [Clostridiales bacterium]